MTQLSPEAADVLARVKAAARNGKTEIQLTPASFNAAIEEFGIDPRFARLNGVKLIRK